MPQFIVYLKVGQFCLNYTSIKLIKEKEQRNEHIFLSSYLSLTNIYQHLTDNGKSQERRDVKFTDKKEQGVARNDIVIRGNNNMPFLFHFNHSNNENNLLLKETMTRPKCHVSSKYYFLHNVLRAT